jgi:hypothetical protein
MIYRYTDDLSTPRPDICMQDQADLLSLNPKDVTKLIKIKLPLVYLYHHSVDDNICAVCFGFCIIGKA